MLCPIHEEWLRQLDLKPSQFIFKNAIQKLKNKQITILQKMRVESHFVHNFINFTLYKFYQNNKELTHGNTNQKHLILQTNSPTENNE